VRAYTTYHLPADSILADLSLSLLVPILIAGEFQSRCARECRFWRRPPANLGTVSSRQGFGLGARGTLTSLQAAASVFVLFII